MSKINIVLTSDNNYAQHLGVAMVSILENYPKPEKLAFHIIENGIKKENKEKILSLKNKYNTSINIYNLSLSKLKNCPSVYPYNSAVYLHLFIPELIPKNIEKIIYLDSDIVSLNNIEELYNQKLNNFPLGAIKDQYENRILKNFFYSGLNSYFNAGVMLIDLKKWRKVKITKKSLEFIKEHKKDLKLHDQDVLNGLFKNNWQSLNKKFNFSAKNKSIPSNVVILHYLTKEKPWSYLYEYKNKKYYWKYLKLSPWPDFKYLDKNLNNISKKINKKIAKKAKNFLRPLIPLRIIKKIKKLKKK